jgi:hypothetical protein
VCRTPREVAGAGPREPSGTKRNGPKGGSAQSTHGRRRCFLDRASFWCRKASVQHPRRSYSCRLHLQDAPDIRGRRQSASTAKSSSLRWPDGWLAEARSRISWPMLPGGRAEEARFRWAGRTIIQAELPYRPRPLMRRRSSRLLATRTSTYAQHIDVRGTGCHPRGCNTAYPIKSLFSASISFPRESFFKIRRTIGAGEFPSLAAQIHPLPIQCLVGLARYFSRVSLSGIRNATNAGHISFCSAPCSQ